MEEEARAGMKLAIIVGALLTVAGAALLALTLQPDGNGWFWAVVSGLVLMTGNALYWVAIVAYGVSLGRRSTSGVTS